MLIHDPGSSDIGQLLLRSSDMLLFKNGEPPQIHLKFKKQNNNIKALRLSKL